MSFFFSQRIKDFCLNEENAIIECFLFFIFFTGKKLKLLQSKFFAPWIPFKSLLSHKRQQSIRNNKFIQD